MGTAFYSSHEFSAYKKALTIASNQQYIDNGITMRPLGSTVNEPTGIAALATIAEITPTKPLQPDMYCILLEGIINKPLALASQHTIDSRMQQFIASHTKIDKSIKPTRTKRTRGHRGGRRRSRLQPEV